MKCPPKPVVTACRISRAPRYAACPNEKALTDAVGQDGKELMEKFRREREWGMLREASD